MVSSFYHKMAQEPLSWSLHILYRAVYSYENVCVHLETTELMDAASALVQILEHLEKTASDLACIAR